MPLSDADIGLPPSGTVPNPFDSAGIRNNNPGNLRPPGVSKGFQQFPSMAEGVKAADTLLQHYADKGRTTVGEVISHWAPASENNTSAYIAQVSHKLGLMPDDKLNLQDPKTRAALRDAMLDHETPGWRAHMAAPSKLSDADIGIAHPSGSDVPTSKATPQTAVSGADLGHFLSRAGKDIAGVADMFLSAPGNLAATLAAKGYESLAPMRVPGDKGPTIAERASQIRTSVAEHSTSPIAHLMHAMGFKEDYSDADVGKVSKIMQDWQAKGSAWIEQHTGGALNASQVNGLLTDIQNLAPLGFSRFALAQRAKLSPEEIRTGKLNNSTAEDILHRYEEDTGNPDHLTKDQVRTKMEQSLTEKSDAEINAEAKAYELMKRGASLKETQAARKANPLVGAKLDQFMAKRKEVMGGPLSTHLPLDAILDPLEKPPANRLPDQSGATRPATGTPGPDMQSPQPGAPTPPAPNGTDIRALRGPSALRPGQSPVPRLEGPVRPARTGSTDGRVLFQDSPMVTGDSPKIFTGEDAVKGSELPKPSALDRAVQKMAAGQRFTMTAEERIAWNKAQGLGRRQGGAVDMKTLLALSGVAAGAYIGSKMDDGEKLEGAVLGGLAGLAATTLPRYAGNVSSRWAKIAKVGVTTAGVSYGLSQLDSQHPVEGAVLGMLWGATHFLPKAKVPQIGNMTIDDLVNARNGAIAAQHREIGNVAWAMRTAVPDEQRRVAVAQAVEAGSTAGLSANEVRVYNAYRQFTKDFGTAAQSAGVLKDLAQNYVTHVVERERLPQSKIKEVMDALFGDDSQHGAGASPNSRFAKQRKYATFADLQQALQGSGLKIKTQDIAQLVELYGTSMARAIENKKLFDNLKSAKTPGTGGTPFIVEADKAPYGYRSVSSPQLQGLKVHPDLEPALRFVTESTNPGFIMRGLLGLSLAQKRLSTGLSLFHAQNLLNAYIGATGLKSVKVFHDVNAALELYRHGGLGDSVDTLLRGGLRIEKPMETDLNAGVKLGAAIDGLVNGTLGTRFGMFEKGFGSVEKLQRETFDKVTWDYLHSGLKLALATREFEKGLREHPTWTKDEVAKQVSSFVNDTFGGLDWFRVATETQSQLGRQIALAALSPKGRQMMQILMFAPDWTMSTFRAMYKALPGSTAMPLTARLHQKYVMRTAIIWAVLMNGVNQATSGHPIWDNRDPTRIEWRDGTTQQIAKHAMEGPEWLINPRQTALNKMGRIPSEIMNQAMGTEYLRADGKSPPMEGSRGAHLARTLAPMSVSGSGAPSRDLGETAERTVLSAAGMPVYGMTKAERAQAKADRAKTKRHKPYGSTNYGSKRK